MSALPRRDALTIEDIAKQLGRGREVWSQHKRFWSTLCPCHSDESPSLEIAEGDKVPMVLVCRAGCENYALEQALKRMQLWIFPPSTIDPDFVWGPPGHEFVELYEYKNADSSLRFQKIRYRIPLKNNKKHFLQRHWDLNEKKWIYNLRGIEPIIYNLPAVRKADGKRIFIVGGEKDANTVTANGGVGACNYEGEGKWRDSYTQEFPVDGTYLIPDNDNLGYKHANMVGASFARAGKKLRIVLLPGTQWKEDVTDWLNSGCTWDMLESLLTEAFVWTPELALDENRAKPASDDEEEKEPDGTNLAFIPIADGAFGCNDGANATRFIAQHGRNVRYCAANDTWYIWDGKRWKPDEDGSIFELARLTAESISKEPKPVNEEIAKALSRWASTSRNYNKLVAMLKCAQTRDGVRIRLIDFDTELHLINCANGVIDLKTGTRRSHDRKYMFSKLIDIDYDPSAESEEWEKFLMKSMNNDWEMIGFLQRAVGFALSGTGTTVEQKFFVCHGPAGSGKSTFINTIGKIMGDWGTNVESDMFMQKFQKDNQYNPIHLVGKRYISVNELAENEKFDMKFLKTFTGGDPVSGRELYSKKVVTYQPQGAVFMRSNHRPIAGADSGFWRRIYLIPFPNKILEENFDGDLPVRLVKELKGILAWAVFGAQEWYRTKLNAPEKVKLVTKEYEVEQDYLGECVEENFEKGAFPLTECAGLEQTYQFYESWAEKTGNPKLRQRKLFEELKSRGFQRERTKTGYVWLGLKLIAPMPEPKSKSGRYRKDYDE